MASSEQALLTLLQAQFRKCGMQGNDGGLKQGISEPILLKGH